MKYRIHSIRQNLFSISVPGFFKRKFITGSYGLKQYWYSKTETEHYINSLVQRKEDRLAMIRHDKEWKKNNPPYDYP